MSTTISLPKLLLGICIGTLCHAHPMQAQEADPINPHNKEQRAKMVAQIKWGRSQEPLHTFEMLNLVKERVAELRLSLGTAPSSISPQEIEKIKERILFNDDHLAWLRQLLANHLLNPEITKGLTSEQITLMQNAINVSEEPNERAGSGAAR